MMLDLACRLQQQYQAALQRISQLDQRHQEVLVAAQQQIQALNHKDAELVAVKQSARNAVVQHMRSTPASMANPLLTCNFVVWFALILLCLTLLDLPQLTLICTQTGIYCLSFGASVVQE